MRPLPSPRLLSRFTSLCLILIALFGHSSGRAATAVSRLALTTQGPEVLWSAQETAPSTDSSGVGGVAPPSSSIWIPAAEEGRVWRADRLQHASASATLVVGAAALGAGDTEAAVLAASIGILKEVGDAAAGGGMSRLDLLADVVGIGLGLVFVAAAR